MKELSLSSSSNTMMPMALLKLLPALFLSFLLASHQFIMPFGLSPAVVAEYASKPFVRAALENPSAPGSVLSFFLGVDYDNDPCDSLREGKFCTEMSPFWFGGGPEYDELCKPFCPVIRDAGNKKLPHEFWNTCVDGQVSQLILCDQLSRNCFRGTDEAFAFDDVSLDIARSLAKCDILQEEDSDLEGEFYPPYATFVLTALMHSECLEDHETSLAVVDWASEKAPQLKEWWDNQRSYELEHKKVIDEFGRYPYRNKKKGRESTEKELEWLANEDELPLWAKSQL